MVSLDIARSGPVMGARQAAWFNMGDSTRQQRGLKRLNAGPTSQESRLSASGVTVAKMDQ